MVQLDRLVKKGVGLGARQRKGKENAKKEEKRRIAKQMVADKMPIELIARYSGLSEKEIKNL